MTRFMKQCIRIPLAVFVTFCISLTGMHAQQSCALSDRHRAILDSVTKLEGLGQDEADRVNYFVALIYANAKDARSSNKFIDSIADASLRLEAAQGCATLFAAHDMPIASFDSLGRRELATRENLMLTFLSASGEMSLETAREFTTFPQVSNIDRCRMLIIAAGHSERSNGLLLLQEVRRDYPMEMLNCLQELIQSLCLLGDFEEAATLLAVDGRDQEQTTTSLDSVLSGLIFLALKHKEPASSVRLVAAIKDRNTRRSATAELLYSLSPGDLHEADLINLQQLTEDVQLTYLYQRFHFERLLSEQKPGEALKTIMSESMDEAMRLECCRQLVNYYVKSGQKECSRNLLAFLSIAAFPSDSLSECHRHVLAATLNEVSQDALDAILREAIDWLNRSSLQVLIEERRHLKMLLEDIRGLSLSGTQKESLRSAIRIVVDRMQMLEANTERHELLGIGEVVLSELAAFSPGVAAESYNELSEGLRKALSAAFASSVLTSENLDDVLGRCSVLTVPEQADLMLRVIIEESVTASFKGLIYVAE